MRSFRNRSLVGLVAALAVAAILVPIGSSKTATHAGVPTIYVQYAMNCTFSFVDDSGHPITSIAPGTYEVEVSTPIMFKLVDTLNQAPGDFTGCRGWVQFQMTGPGVNLSTTLDTGCDSNYLLPETTFKAGQTYNAVDLNQPSVAHDTLTVLNAGQLPSPTSPYGTGYRQGLDLAGHRRVAAGEDEGQGDADGLPELHRRPRPEDRREDDLDAHAGSLPVRDHRQGPEGGFHARRRQGDQDAVGLGLRRQAHDARYADGRTLDVFRQSWQGILLHRLRLTRPVFPASVCPGTDRLDWR